MHTVRDFGRCFLQWLPKMWVLPTPDGPQTRAYRVCLTALNKIRHADAFTARQLAWLQDHEEVLVGQLGLSRRLFQMTLLDPRPHFDAWKVALQHLRTRP